MKMTEAIKALLEAIKLGLEGGVIGRITITIKPPAPKAK